MLFPRGRLRRAVLHEVRPYIGGRLWRAFVAGGLTRGKTLQRRAFAADIADVIAVDVIAGVCGGHRGRYRGYFRGHHRRHHRLAAADDDDMGTIISFPLASVSNLYP